jgi:hypothetical protein
MSEWISVKDRLPELCKDVLVWVVKPGYKTAAITAGLFEGFGKIIVGNISDVGWASWEDEEEVSGEITHWQPLPAPPEATE